MLPSVFSQVNARKDLDLRKDLMDFTVSFLNEIRLNNTDEKCGEIIADDFREIHNYGVKDKIYSRIFNEAFIQMFLYSGSSDDAQWLHEIYKDSHAGLNRLERFNFLSRIIGAHVAFKYAHR